MKGVIITNGYANTEGIAYQVKRLIEEFSALGVEVENVKTDTLIAYISGGKVECNITADFIIYLDKDVHIASMLEKAGYRLFNTREAIEVCDDKIKTHIALSGCGVNMPDTISSPLMYREVEDEFYLSVERLGYPMVVKEAHGSLGGGVWLVKNRQELIALRQKLKMKPHLYQKFIESSKGKDYRVIVVGGKVVAYYMRESTSDFRSNIELGGTGKKVDLPIAYVNVAEKVSKILGLDYCGVDLLIGCEPIVCEVNSNAFFTGAEKVTGVNVARRYVEYILEQIKN